MTLPAALHKTISELLHAATNSAIENGWDRITMPEEYAALAEWLRHETAPERTVPIPTDADMAVAMIGLGINWLKNNAPERLRTSHFDNAGDAAHLPQPVSTRQYYAKNNKCQAATAYKPSCICWWDEGTGPFPKGDKGLTWRVKK